MTSLICLVQRLFLGNEQRTLIKEGEQFDVDEQTAQIYIKGGIAKEAPKNGPVQTETPKEVKQEDPVTIVDETVVLPPEQKIDKRRKKA